MGTSRSRTANRLARRLTLALLCSAGALSLVFAGSGARAASAPAPTTLYYEAQTGPRTFAVEARDLSAHRPSTQVVALRNYNVYGIAVGGRSIYWSTQSGPRDRGSIMQAPLGGGRAHRLVGGLTEPASVVVVGRHVYWDDRSAIGRVALNGSHPQPKLIRLPAEAGGGVTDGLTSDGRHLYFSRCADDTIGRANLNGSHVHQRFISIGERRCPQGLAAAGGHIFWTELGQGIIGRASLDGRGVNPHWLHIHSRQGPFQVAVGGDHVYWTWGGENGSPSYTGRADVNRSHLDRRFLLDSMYPMALTG
ncbi:MAG TPA: hypothetical protein VGL69_22535 [Solirubrobacteraceae bacterium]|jgi:hypothetical protein